MLFFLTHLRSAFLVLNALVLLLNEVLELALAVLRALLAPSRARFLVAQLELVATTTAKSNTSTEALRDDLAVVRARVLLDVR